MCGIAGVLGDPDAEAVRTLTLALKHRGPDSLGFYHRGDLHLGMTRLSIIDLEHGDQPIFNESRDKVIVFNGEIYNYRELREKLTAAGHTFSTRSDTEVILHLYEEHGERCVEHLQGMFAFAIADGDGLFVARDRLGIKPLYYVFLPEENLFLFASECKALLRCRKVPAELNRQALADRLVLTYVPGRQTLFRGIECVRAGETMTVVRDRGALSLHRRQYYQQSWQPVATLGFEESREKLTHLFRTAVQSHLVSDVEVALTLSGGSDSSFLALTMNEMTDGEFLAFTIGSEETQEDVVHAKALARHLKTRHDVWISSFDDFLAAIPACIAAEECPSSLTAMPVLLLCRRIGERAKVRLNGEGADELFGGYREYAEPEMLVRMFRHNLPALKRLGVFLSDEALGIVRRLSRCEPYDQYLQSLFEIYLQESLVRQHLEIADRFGMAASLEVRVPYLDHVLVDFVNRLPVSYKVYRSNGAVFARRKILLKSAAIKAYGERIHGIAARKKIGFPGAGLRHVRKFDRWCEELLPADYLKRHEMGECFSYKRELLVFELFQHLFFERRGELDNGLDVMDFLRSRIS